MAAEATSTLYQAPQPHNNLGPAIKDRPVDQVVR
jgi:hypothetical protein